MKFLRLLTILTASLSAFTLQAKTLIVYYSYTNNVHAIVTALKSIIEADVLRIEPSEKGLDYAANNYAIGSAQIQAIRNNPDAAESYPGIDPVNVDLKDYDCIIVGAPLWWSNMAAPLQSYLFRYGKEMAGKRIGLIVSSASSGINNVEADARRLIPGGDFYSPSLWIRSSQTSNASQMLTQWLNDIDYDADDEPTGLGVLRSSDTDSSFSITTDGKTITVTSSCDCVKLHDLAGRCIYTGRPCGITVENQGIYFVTVNNTTRKIKI